jgi:phosphohistidine phosphatase
VKLYLVRHAESRPEYEDPSKGLSEKGIQDVTKVSKAALDRGVRVMEVFHSGKKRAEQTAQIIAGYLKPQRGVSQTDGLAPKDDPNIWVERLRDFHDDIMLVGHLPHMSDFAALLLQGKELANSLTFEGGGIVCFEKTNDGTWSILWSLMPSQL